jgi:hypothetical protein
MAACRDRIHFLRWKRHRRSTAAGVGLEVREKSARRDELLNIRVVGDSQDHPPPQREVQGVAAGDRPVSGGRQSARCGQRALEAPEMTCWDMTTDYRRWLGAMIAEVTSRLQLACPDIRPEPGEQRRVVVKNNVASTTASASRGCSRSGDRPRRPGGRAARSDGPPRTASPRAGRPQARTCPETQVEHAVGEYDAAVV